MEQKRRLEEMNAECVLKLEEFLKSNKDLNEDDHKKLHTAKEEWQLAWIKIREALMVLERIEI